MVYLNLFDKTFKICNDWEEVTFGQYIDILNIQKNNYYHIQGAIKTIAAVSTEPELLEKYIYKMSEKEFEDLNTQFDFTAPDFTTYTATTNVLLIDGKTYKIKEDYHKLTMGEMSCIEIVMANDKGLDKNEIAFGVLLREVDADGKEKEFSEDVFYTVIKKLRDKVLLKDIYQHLLFFSLGTGK